MTGDGNGWVICAAGHRHWGRFGAAGLLLTDGTRVLLQHRAGWTHEGGTWAFPGGARDSHEDAFAAALREAHEEVGLDPATVEPILPPHPDDHGGWTYTTVLARVTGPVAVDALNPESHEVRWVALADVEHLPLHAGFRAAWPDLHRRLLAETAGPAG